MLFFNGRNETSRLCLDCIHPLCHLPCGWLIDIGVL